MVPVSLLSEARWLHSVHSLALLVTHPSAPAKSGGRYLRRPPKGRKLSSSKKEKELREFARLDSGTARPFYKKSAEKEADFAERPNPMLADMIL